MSKQSFRWNFPTRQVARRFYTLDAGRTGLFVLRAGMGRAVALKSRPDNGRVERMNRTIKDATVKRFHCDNHDQLRTHLDDLVTAYNFAKRLKTLKGLTPYEFICRRWTVEPEQFNSNPL